VRHATLLDVNGPRVLVALAIPALIAMAPVLVPRFWVRIVAGLALATIAVVGGFSIGLFYAPSTIMMLLAGLLAAPAWKL
jgi:hypothetical protein